MKFSEKTWFLEKKNAFLKLENIHNLDTYFHPLRNIVWKLFDDKCIAKACEILRWIDIQEVVFFHAAIVSFFKGQNVALLTVTLLTMIFSLLLKWEGRIWTFVC